MGINRRNFLKVAGTAGGILLAGGAKSARTAQTPQTSGGSVEFYGLLIDTTKCIGCRSCEEACNAKNSLPKPEVSFSSESVFEKRRDTTPDAYVVVNRFPNEEGPGEADLRPEAVHALHRAFLRLGLPVQGDGEDARRTDRLPQGSLHGMPILHDFVPFRCPEIRIRQRFPVREEVHRMPRPRGEG